MHYNPALNSDAKGFRSLRSLHPFAPVSLALCFQTERQKAEKPQYERAFGNQNLKESNYLKVKNFMKSENLKGETPEAEKAFRDSQS